MFEELERINKRPEPFEFYSAKDLWTDEHRAQQMLWYHLNEEYDLSSRKPLFMDRSVEWIVSQFGVGEGTRIADFGCGPGLYCNRLAQTGADVTGIDFSLNSIRYARERAKEQGLAIRYIHEDYLQADRDGEYDLILMIMCDFSALSPGQRHKVLNTFCGCLADGGAVLLDVHSIRGFEERSEKTMYEAGLLDGFWSSNAYYGFLNTFKYEEEKVVLDKYTIVESGGVETVYNWLQYFTREDVEKEFSECGVRVREIFGDVAGLPYDPAKTEFAVVGERR